MICRGRLWRSFCYIMANIKAQQKGRSESAPTIWLCFVNDFVGDAALGVPKQVLNKLRAHTVRPYKMFVFQ